MTLDQWNRNPNSLSFNHQRGTVHGKQCGPREDNAEYDTSYGLLVYFIWQLLLIENKQDGHSHVADMGLSQNSSMSVPPLERVVRMLVN